MSELLCIRLRKVRNELRMDQSRLAQLASVSEKTVQVIEDGLKQFPQEIYALAKALDVNPAWLAFGDEWATRERVVVVENTNKKSQSARKVAHV